MTMLDDARKEHETEARLRFVSYLCVRVDSWFREFPREFPCFLPMQAKQEAFVSERGNDVTCQACPPGRSSALVTDQDGDTAECRPLATLPDPTANGNG